MTQNSVVNLGEVSKPATVLIEKIAEAVGGACRPFQIRRVAEAEAAAELTKAKAHIEIAEIQRRALTRFLQEEEIRQANMEKIAEKAFPLLKDTAKPDQMENDWIANFFDKCRLTSDGEMQKIWSAILAGEANQPGGCSKRTVNLLASMDKKDAELFSRLVNYSWQIGANMPLIYDYHHEVYKKNDIRFVDLKHLDDIGLVRFDSSYGFKSNAFPKNITLMYQDRAAILGFKNAQDNSLEFGKLMLSKSGQELSAVCELKPVEGYFEYVIEYWRAQGVSVNVP